MTKTPDRAAAIAALGGPDRARTVIREARPDVPLDRESWPPRYRLEAAICDLALAAIDTAGCDRLATDQRMMMARLSGYDECPQDPVAAVMHVADCFDAMTQACVHQVDANKSLRTHRDALLALLEQCDVFLRIHATPGNELKADVQAAIRAAKEITDGK